MLNETVPRARAGSMPGTLERLAGVLICLSCGWPVPHVCAQPPGRTESDIRQAILVAEDERAPRADDLDRLIGALRSRSPEIQRVAVRALGRLERASLVSVIAPMLAAGSAAVRREAANALAQSLFQAPPAAADRGGMHTALAARHLGQRLEIETDPGVREAILRAIGRLPYSTAAEAKSAEAALVAEFSPDRPIERSSHFGAVKGLESLVRLHGKMNPPSSGAVTRLKAVVESPPLAPAAPRDGRSVASAGEESAARQRRLALLALLSAGSIDERLVKIAQQDEDVEVRRLAAVAVGLLDDAGHRADLAAVALRDRSPQVRYEALRTQGRSLPASDCAPVLKGAADTDRHVALLALDLLAERCSDEGAARDALTDAADDRSQGWHRVAHAVVSLARRFPDAARERLARFVARPVWQVRMYAARAATALGAADALYRLAHDPDDNVCEAAVAGLLEVKGHDADEVFIDALRRPDYQLARTAANALKGTPRPADAAAALVSAFHRLSGERRDTSRDARLAILERLREVGDAATADALSSCLRDFDPRIAGECAATLTALTGRPHRAGSLPRPRRTVPSPARLARLASARARVTIRGRGVFELTLLASEAPLTVARFVDLARAGYYNGLTFHRVVPNFVVQGGSPGANEYMGDGPYLRDEVGLDSHVRGAVGISTRGRDTGDAQIFVNLVDNPRLDHNYTVFARVAARMDIIDDVVEGDVIDRIEIFR